MNIISTKENYLIIDRAGATYVLELGTGFKTPVSIHITIWCVMDYPFRWDVEVDILGLILVLIHNDGWHEALPIISGKDK